MSIIDWSQQSKNSRKESFFFNNFSNWVSEVGFSQKSVPIYSAETVGPSLIESRASLGAVGS